ncbi:MAG: hypothetical protein ACYS8W_05750 [Planctomycetota bacterium]|jgi:hypothetical protein
MRAVKLFLLIIPALLLTGCSYRASIGTNLAEEKVNSIRSAGADVQVSSEKVRDLFGEPQMIVNLGEGRERWTYLESRVSSTAWLVVSGYLVYRPSRVEVTNSMLEVIIKDDKVENVLFAPGEQPEEVEEVAAK